MDCFAPRVVYSGYVRQAGSTEARAKKPGEPAAPVHHDEGSPPLSRESSRPDLPHRPTWDGIFPPLNRHRSRAAPRKKDRELNEQQPRPGPRFTIEQSTPSTKPGRRADKDIFASASRPFREAGIFRGGSQKSRPD